MNDLVMNHSGVLTLSDSDRIRIAAAWEALSVNSRRSYQGVCPHAFFVAKLQEIRI